MDNTVEEMLHPSNSEDGSICHLKVLKSASSGVGREGELVEVRLRRTREDVLSEVTKTFDLLGDITAHATHLGDDAKMAGLVDELGKLVLRSMLDVHDRNVMVSRQHSAEAMECIKAIAAAKEAATQLLECKESAGAKQWQRVKENFLRLGEEQKRLIKALEQQLDYAQEKNAELSQRLIKEQVPSVILHCCLDKTAVYSLAEQLQHHPNKMVFLSASCIDPCLPCVYVRFVPVCMSVPVTLGQNSMKDIEQQSVRRDIVRQEMDSVNARSAELEAALSEMGKALQVAGVTETHALLKHMLLCW
jgi:hypothetical protein